MGAFSGKFIGDTGRYTFQQVIDRVASALEKADAQGRADNIQVEVTVRGPDTVDTIVVPTDSLREVVEILKLNAS